MNILIVPNDPLSSYSDLDRWNDRPMGYQERGHKPYVFPMEQIMYGGVEKAIRDYDIDVVRTLEGGRWMISYYAAKACEKTNTPLAISLHGELEEISKSRGYKPEHLKQMRAWRRYAESKASHIYVVQKSYVRYYSETEHYPKVSFLPNYVRLDQFNEKQPPQGNRVMYVGRMEVGGKDAQTLLDSTRLIDSDDFWFVGRGPLEAEITKSGHKLINGVPNSEVPHLMSTAKVVFYGWEKITGFGIPVMEAQACSRPVVISRKGFTEAYLNKYEPIEDVSYFMNPKYRTTSTQELAEKVNTLLQDPAEWQRVSKEGRARMEKNFDRDMILDRELAIMEELI